MTPFSVAARFALEISVQIGNGWHVLGGLNSFETRASFAIVFTFMRTLLRFPILKSLTAKKKYCPQFGGLFGFFGFGPGLLCNSGTYFVARSPDGSLPVCVALIACLVALIFKILRTSPIV